MAEIKKLKKRVGGKGRLGRTITYGFEVLLTHEEVEQIARGGGAVVALPGLPPPAKLAIGLAGAALVAICALGGHDGVRIIITAIAPGQIVVLPR
jgi:hypothetical protein